MQGWITFALLLLTVLSGALRKIKIHSYLATLTLFSLLLHSYFTLSFSPSCIFILSFSFITFLTGFEKIRILNRRELHMLFGFLTLLLAIFHVYPFLPFQRRLEIMKGEIVLPPPRYSSNISVEEAIFKRRSVREYQDKAVSLEQLAQILWAAQGITSEWGGRTAPSAGGTYPLEVYVVVRKVEKLEPGVYLYIPHTHSLATISKGNYSQKLMEASLNQKWVSDASFNLIIAADFSRTTQRYGERGIRYVYLEAGHAAQNVYLQAVSLKLGCVVVGAFNDNLVKSYLELPANVQPIYIIPVGIPLK
jgi:SagB-type dehydrogenase family enzyme